MAENSMFKKVCVSLISRLAKIVMSPLFALIYIVSPNDSRVIYTTNEQCELLKKKESVTKPLNQNELDEIGKVETKLTLARQSKQNIDINHLYLKAIEKMKLIQTLLIKLQNIKDDKKYTIIDSDKKIYSVHMLSDNSTNTQNYTKITTINNKEHLIKIKRITDIQNNNLQNFLNHNKTKREHNEIRVMTYLYEMVPILKAIESKLPTKSNLNESKLTESTKSKLKEDVNVIILIEDIFIELYNILIYVRSDLINFNQEKFDDMLYNMYGRVNGIQNKLGITAGSNFKANISGYIRRDTELIGLTKILSTLKEKLNKTNNTKLIAQINGEIINIEKQIHDIQHRTETPKISEKALQNARKKFNTFSQGGKSKKNSNRHKQRKQSHKQSRKHL